ncbi:MAG TPA: HEAT repeat domain-containing protein [Aggregatilineales bacterium]|nr:HEAT repeat domain-containing protein [Aggregatilineales bacterium]
MSIQALFVGLKDPQPAARIRALYVLAMVEEVEALPVLREMLQWENHPAVVEEIKRTGRMLTEAQKRGHSTDAGIRAQFRLHLEKSAAEIEDEKRMALARAQAEAQTIRDRKDSTAGKAGMALAAGALASMVGGSSFGASVVASSMGGAVSAAASSLGETRPQIGLQPIPPQRPSDHDIEIWLKRLKDSDPQKRQTAVVELKGFNNPRALPHLAMCYGSDPEPKLREEAQKAGKSIYYNWLYWERTQAIKQTQVLSQVPPASSPDATRTLTQEMPAVQASEASAAAKPVGIETPSDRQEIAEILERARAKREAREQKKRH